MMKVKTEKGTYLVHFETRKHMANTGDKELTNVTCVIRFVEPEFRIEAQVKQNYQDACDMVFARKLAFSRAIGSDCDEDLKENRLFSKQERTIFWNKFKNECRYKV